LGRHKLQAEFLFDFSGLYPPLAVRAARWLQKQPARLPQDGHDAERVGPGMGEHGLQRGALKGCKCRLTARFSDFCGIKILPICGSTK